jgi:hypothetical protein
MNDNQAECASALTPRFGRLLEAVTGDGQYRELRGDTLIDVTIGHWSAQVPLSEVYGAVDKIGRAAPEPAAVKGSIVPPPNGTLMYVASLLDGIASGSSRPDGFDRYFGNDEGSEQVYVAFKQTALLLTQMSNAGVGGGSTATVRFDRLTMPNWLSKRS